MPRLRSRSRVSWVAVGRVTAEASAEAWAPPWVESCAWAAIIFFWAAGEKGDRLLVSLPVGGGGTGRGPPRSLQPHQCGLRPEAGSSASPWGSLR